MSLRVVIVTRIPPVLAAFDAVVRGTGHEPVAFLTMRNVDGRYGPPADTGDLVLAAADELDVLLPAHRRTIAPLLASVEPDLVVCMGFPWKIPPAALAVPRLGWLNGHPSLLPRHRGPLPVASPTKAARRTSRRSSPSAASPTRCARISSAGRSGSRRSIRG